MDSEHSIAISSHTMQDADVHIHIHNHMHVHMQPQSRQQQRWARELLTTNVQTPLPW